MADALKRDDADKLKDMPCRPVVICGGGPAGTMLALYLCKHGIPVVLLEKDAVVPRDLRASTFHPPTLEMLEAVAPDVLKDMLAKGLRVDHYQYRDRKSGDVADFQMNLIADQTSYPFRLQLEQWEMVLLGHNKLKRDYASFPPSQQRPEVPKVTLKIQKSAQMEAKAHS